MSAPGYHSMSPDKAPMSPPPTRSVHDDKEFSCVYCWHNACYHPNGGPCTVSMMTTGADMPCDCPGFHSRRKAIELMRIGDERSPSDPIVYPANTTDKEP